MSLTPCRIADTRVGGGKVLHDHPRTFYVAGTFGFAPQGGHAGGCGVPVGAASVALTVTTTNATGPGNLNGYAAGSPAPASTFASFNAGLNLSGNPILPLAASSTPQLTITGHGGNTDVVVDVTGYYADQMEGLIYTGTSSSPGSVYSGSPRVLAVTWVSTGVADVTVDRDVTYCTPEAGGYYDSIYYANAKAFNGNKIRVYIWYLDSTTHLPAAVDNYVYLTVSC